MKKRLSYLIVLLFVFCFYMMPIYADSGFEFKAQVDNTEVVVGSEATIKVLIKSNQTDGLTTCRFKAISDSGMELVSKNEANNWKISSSSSDIYLLEDTSEVGLTIDNSGNGKAILEFKYKINANSKLSFTGIECANATNDFTHGDVTVNFTTKEVSADNTLSALEITNGEITTVGGFTPDNTSYTVNINSSNFGIVATASNSDYQSTIKITDESGKELNASNITFSPNSQGMMLVLITVNNNKVYNLLINRDTSGDIQEYDNTLKSLTVGGKNVDLASCTKEGSSYTCSVALNSRVDSYTVKAVLNDPNNFEFDENNGGNGNYTTDSFLVIIKPKDTSLGVSELRYIVNVSMPGSDSNPSSSKPSSSSNVVQNPQTGSISSFVMAIVLVFSLVASVILYQKNMESYK